MTDRCLRHIVGKVLLALGFTAATMMHGADSAGPPTSADQPPPIFRQDFETQVSGQAPDGWSFTWNNAGDSQFIVSNLAAVEGKQSLLFATGGNGGISPFCVRRSLGEAPLRGWTTITFHVRIEGPGATSQFRFTMGDGGHRRETVNLEFSFRGAGPTILLYPNFSAYTWHQNYDGRKLLCHWEREIWHRITVLLPGQDVASQAYCQVERQDGNGQWQMAGPPQSVPADPRQDRQVWFAFLPHGGTRDMNLFIDDITMRPGQPPPAESATKNAP